MSEESRSWFEEQSAYPGGICASSANLHFRAALYRISQQSTAAQHSRVKESIVQHSTAQQSTAQHSTAQHSTAQHSTAQHSTAQHSTAQHSREIYLSIFESSMALMECN
jgi:hypothetical protein